MVAIVLVVALSSPVVAGAQKPPAGGHWVSAWSTAIHAPLPFPGLPPTPVFEKQTLRMVVKPTIGGERLRIRLSNAFGSSALTIGAAHVALVQQGPRIVPESDRALTFGGRASVTIPPGAPVLSDPVDLKVAAFTEIAIRRSTLSGRDPHGFGSREVTASYSLGAFHLLQTIGRRRASRKRGIWRKRV